MINTYINLNKINSTLSLNNNSSLSGYTRMYYLESVYDLPEIGEKKVFYFITSELLMYIWNDKYIKLNSDLLDMIQELYELTDNTELKEQLAQYITKLQDLENSIDGKISEALADIEFVGMTEEQVDEKLQIISEEFLNYSNSVKNEINDFNDILTEIEDSIEDINSNMNSITKDDIITQAEKVVLKKDKERLLLDYNLLEKEYNDICNIVNQKQNENAYIIEKYGVSLSNLNSLWYSGNINYNIDNIVETNPNLINYGVKNLYELIFKLIDYIIKENNANLNKFLLVWDNVISELTNKTSELKVEIKSLNNKLTLIDAEDATGELVANINLRYIELYGGLQALIDGQITNWNGKGEPYPQVYVGDNLATAEVTQDDYNYPANEWWYGPIGNVVDYRDLHINDTYVDLNTGKAYRWCKESVGNYHWHLIDDSDITKALAKAAELEGALDGKTTTFIEEPKHPYHKGDLWIVHNNNYGKKESDGNNIKYKKGEILNCILNSVNEFNVNDWNREVSYLDLINNVNEVLDSIDNDDLISISEQLQLKLILKQILEEYLIITEHERYLFISESEEYKLYNEYYIKSVNTIKYHIGELVWIDNKEYKLSANAITGAYEVVGDEGNVNLRYTNILEYYNKRDLIKTKLEQSYSDEAASKWDKIIEDGLFSVEEKQIYIDKIRKIFGGESSNLLINNYFETSSDFKNIINYAQRIQYFSSGSYDPNVMRPFILGLKQISSSFDSLEKTSLLFYICKYIYMFIHIDILNDSVELINNKVSGTIGTSRQEFTEERFNNIKNLILQSNRLIYNDILRDKYDLFTLSITKILSKSNEIDVIFDEYYKYENILKEECNNKTLQNYTDVKYDDSITKINAANNAVSNLSDSLGSTKEELLKAIADAKAEIAQDIELVSTIINYSFEDNKITPSEKLSLLAELREICGYLFGIENNKIKLFDDNSWSKHSYDLTAFKNLFKVTEDSGIRWFNYALINYYYNTKKINFHEQGSYASIIRLKLKDVDFNTAWYDFNNDQSKFSLIHSNELNELSVKLQDLFDLFNSLNIGNLNETTTIQADSTTKQQLTQAFTDYYNQELAIIKSILDEVAANAEANAKKYSDTLISGVNTSIATLNGMFADGVLLPNEKKNIEYKIYSMFGLPLTTYSQNTLLFKQGSGTNTGLSIVSTANNTSSLRAFVSWIKSCEADCDFVNTIKLLNAYFPSDDPYESSGIYGGTFNVDLQVIELRNQLNNFLTIFLPDNSYGCYFNKIIASLELFNGKPTTLTDPTEFLSWCEIFEKSLNIIKFTFLEYRLSKAELILSAL